MILVLFFAGEVHSTVSDATEDYVRRVNYGVIFRPIRKLSVVTDV